MKQILFPIMVISLFLFGCDLITAPKSETVTVVAPESKPSNFETDDSSFLVIKIKNEHYDVAFLNKNSSIENLNTLDRFLQENKNLIHEDKIAVTGFDTTINNQPFKDLLKKHGFTRFRMNVE